MKVYQQDENHDGTGERPSTTGVLPSVSDLSAVTRLIFDRMADCNYMIGLHRQGITLNSRRIAQLRARLASIAVRK